MVEGLDAWISKAFDPDNVEETHSALMRAQSSPPGSDVKCQLARERIASCEQRLERLRAALESGDADPKVVGRWIAEVQAERREADMSLRASQKQAPATITASELRAFLQELDVRDALASPERAVKKRFYEDLGLRLTYEPSGREVAVQAAPTQWTKVGVGGANLTAFPALETWRRIA